MDELTIRKALANLTDDSDIWKALDAMVSEGRDNATLTAIDVAVKGEDRTWQCGYAAALADLHRQLERYRKG